MTLTITPAPIRKSILVRAPQERAFRVFTSRMGTWWRPDYHIGKTPFADVVMEPHAGGRWFERDADGVECEWGKVLVWEPPAHVILAWQLDANWQYDPDFVTELEISFTAEGEATTRVDLEHRGLDRYGDRIDETRGVYDAPNGWTGILTGFAESIDGK